MSNDVAPYKISVPDTQLDALSKKLLSTSFPDELDEAYWEYGAPLADIRKLTAYWKDSFSWRDAEARLNALPNFQTTVKVDGFEPLKIHFVHQQSKLQTAIPLLFVHGCM